MERGEQEGIANESDRRQIMFSVGCLQRLGVFNGRCARREDAVARRYSSISDPRLAVHSTRPRAVREIRLDVELITSRLAAMQSR